MNKLKPFGGLFSSRILERGEEYYFSGLVGALELSDSKVRARVRGSEEYEVCIGLKDGRVAEMHCGCPYAADGHNCKHMAAVLFAIKDGEAPSCSEDRGEESIEELAAMLDEGQLRGLVIELARKNEGIENRLRAMTAGSKPVAERVFDRELRLIIENAADRDGFIDYDRAYGCMMEIIGFMDDTVSLLLRQGAYTTAVDCVCRVFTCVQETEMDDSDGGLLCVLDECGSLWADIISQTSAADRDVIYSKLVKLTSGGSYDVGGDFIEDVLFSCFEDREKLKNNLKLIDSRLESSVCYDAERYVDYRTDCMRRLGCAADEIETFTGKFRHLPSVRQQEISRAIDGKNYDLAERLLKESIEADREYKGLVCKYQEQLIDVYEKSGRRELYISSLKEYLHSQYQNDLDYIHRYKKAIGSAAWKEELHVLCELPGFRWIKLSLLADEREYELLFNAVKKEAALQSFCKYDDILKSVYPEETLKLYIRLLNEAMRMASSRDKYADIIRHFKRLKNYPKGGDLCRELAESWREGYPRRMAMLDELRRAKF